MPRRTRLPPAEAKAAFLAALARGARVVEAALAGQATAKCFYEWRHSDPAFDSAWSRAAAASRWVVEPDPDGRMRRRRTKRRVRFAAAARAAFLARLPEDCNTGAAAIDTGFSPCTIHRHVALDPGFARDNQAALEEGYARLELALQEERRAAAEPRALPAATGEPPRDFDTQMRLLLGYRRRDGRIGPRKVSRQRLKRWTFERAMDLLERRLRALGIIARG